MRVMAEPSETAGDRIARRIRAAWADEPALRVQIAERTDGLTDLRVTSRRFAGLSAAEREAVLWEVLREADRVDLLQMTYGLLLSHEEAAIYDSSQGSAD